MRVEARKQNRSTGFIVCRGIPNKIILSVETAEAPCVEPTPSIGEDGVTGFIVETPNFSFF